MCPDDDPRGHDPSHVREPEEHVALLHVRLEVHLRGRLDEEPGVDVNRTFRLARRARRVTDHQRMLESTDEHGRVPAAGHELGAGSPRCTAPGGPASRERPGARPTGSTATPRRPPGSRSRRPRRTVASAVITARAPLSVSRAAIAGAANPENSGTTTAPSRTTPYQATTASAVYGMTDATRHLTGCHVRRGPRRHGRSRFGVRRTSWSAAGVLALRADRVCSPRPASTCRSMQLKARFSRPPGNQRVHSMPARSSSTVS